MSTRSTIARKTKDGIESIYCHFDGYPDGVGALLKEHYQLEEKINKLFEFGDLSILDVDIGVQQENKWMDRVEGWCYFYGRDAREDDTESMIHENINTWLSTRKHSWCEYGYLWNGNEWETFEIVSDIP